MKRSSSSTRLGKCFQPALQFRHHLARRGNSADGQGSPLLQFFQVTPAFADSPEPAIVKAAAAIFAIVGDERHGGPFLQQCQGGLHLALLQPEFFRDYLVKSFMAASLAPN